MGAAWVTAWLTNWLTAWLMEAGMAMAIGTLDGGGTPDGRTGGALDGSAGTVDVGSMLACATPTCAMLGRIAMLAGSGSGGGCSGGGCDGNGRGRDCSGGGWPVAVACPLVVACPLGTARPLAAVPVPLTTTGR